MKNRILYLLLLVSFELFGQKNILCRVDPISTNRINIKWYFPDLVNTEGVFVFRKEITDHTWIKLTPSPLLFNSYKISGEELEQDPELKSYLELTSNPKNLVDLPLMAVLIKSFKSRSLCQFLGIWYDDESVVQGKEYQYKIIALNRQKGNDSIISTIIKAGNYNAIDAPQNIEYAKGNKKVSFRWLPEPNKYFGVNIYRQTNDSGPAIKITKDPILLSKTKNEKGDDFYGDEFYVDVKLIPNTKYNYTFEAIDYFGSPSIRSAALQVNLKDLDPPKAPDTIYHKVVGKNVVIYWSKKIMENDLASFTIYRTLKSDTDFVKLNATPINKTIREYTDSVKEFGSFLYAVSCVDKDQNETVSNPYFIEVYDNEAPAKPKNVRIRSDSCQFYLYWDKNTEKDLKGYLIYRTVNINNENTFVKITPKPLLENYFVDVLSKNIKNTFLYKVVAVDESMNRSLYSEFASAKMKDVTAPLEPFLKNAFFTEKQQILIEWFPNAEPDLKGYNIYKRVFSDSMDSFVKYNSNLIHIGAFRFTDRYIEEGSINEYYIEASDSSGNISKPSNTLKVKVKKREANGTPEITNFAAKYNSKKNRVELNWKIKNEYLLKAKIMYKKKQCENIFTPLSGIINEDKMIDNDINKGEQYTYHLRIYHIKGDVYKSKSIPLQIQ